MDLAFDTVAELLSALALTIPRIAAAFIMLPMLTEETMPAMVRNSFFVSLAIVALPFAAASAPFETITGVMWLLIILKEMFIGLCIGFLFGIIFWAIGNVGSLIDTKAGTNMAAVVDPLQGHQTTLTGSFLSRLAGWLFMATGGFLVFLDLLFSSYAVWPVASGFPSLTNAGQWLFVDGFSRLMVLSLLLAAPALLVLSLVDIGFGLINRYAQQLNVFILSLSIKAWLSIWIVLLCLGVFVEFIIRHIAEGAGVMDGLRKIFR